MVNYTFFIFLNDKNYFWVGKSFSTKCNPERCLPGPIRFYEDMYCKPIYIMDRGCCPSEYDCSEVYKYKVSEHCFINDKVYGINEKLDKEHFRNQTDCHCIKDDSNK